MAPTKGELRQTSACQKGTSSPKTPCSSHFNTRTSFHYFSTLVYFCTRFLLCFSKTLYIGVCVCVDICTCATYYYMSGYVCVAGRCLRECVLCVCVCTCVSSMYTYKRLGNFVVCVCVCTCATSKRVLCVCGTVFVRRCFVCVCVWLVCVLCVPCACGPGVRVCISLDPLVSIPLDVAVLGRPISLAPIASCTVL